MLGPGRSIPTSRDQRVRPLLRTVLGEALRRTRLEQGRTLADVASAAKVSMPYLSEIERGRKEASSEVLASICEALRIELLDVLAIIGGDLISDPYSDAQIVRLGTQSSRIGTPPVLGGSEARCLLAA